MINIAFTENEISLFVHVLEHAASEFSNHGCNDVDVTKLGLHPSAADTVRRSLCQSNIIDEEEMYSRMGRKYLQDNQLLSLIHNKFKAMIGLTSGGTEARVIMPLLNAGLAAKLSDTKPLSVIGGRKAVVSDGLTMYEDGFSIWEDEKTHLFYAEMAKANGHKSDAYQTVDGIVAWVIGVYNGSIKDNSRKKEELYRFR